MLQDYLTLRQAYLTRPDTRTQIHQNYVRNLFLYETFRLGGHNLPPTIFENIVSTGKPQSTETTRQAYDLWQAWQYCEKQAALRQPLDLSFVRAVSARIMKHTGGETTTSVGRYDTSLGDFRLGCGQLHVRFYAYQAIRLLQSGNRYPAHQLFGTERRASPAHPVCRRPGRITQCPETGKNQ